MSHPIHPAYTLINEAALPLWNATAATFLHVSGAKVLSILTADDNKTFGIFFPTLPEDHTGAAHILEHCVLCGSAKYPVREPFKEMLKTSLQTYLNAFTYPDRTCYPVASRNLKDYYNLIDVYLDAVFFPRLTPVVLGQEGWRVQWTSTGQLEIQGVVYNEMKGVYASPDGRLQELEQHALFPDTVYRFDYGGHPEHIPDLTFERFAAFHNKFYHPGNAFVGFYGDDDPFTRLELLDRVLQKTTPRSPAPIPELQAPWRFTRRVKKPYPASEEGDEGVFCELAWLLPGLTSDLSSAQCCSVVASLLLHNPASPLRLTLLESGLGEDVIGHGSLQLRQPYFSAGLRGVEEGDEDKVFSLVLETLQKIAKENFRPDLVEGCLNSIEFGMREMNTSARGLNAIHAGLCAWMNGTDPLDALRPEGRIAELRNQVSHNPRLFADWVQENLLGNPNRVEIILAPDSGLGKMEAEVEASRLQVMESRFAANPEEARESRALALAVEEFQNTPDTPEALASLPRLHLKDVQVPSPGAPLEEDRAHGVDVWTSPVDSSGILYVNVLLDFRSVPLEDLPILPLYGRCLTELGAGGLDHLAFNEQVACHTGGIMQQFETAEHVGEGPDVAVFVIHGKCLRAKIPQTLSLLADLLRSPQLGPADRIRQILLEEKANEEADLLQRGNRVVSLRLRAALSSIERPIEEMGGVNYLIALRELVSADPESLRERLIKLHHRLVRRGGLRIHFGGDAECIAEARALEDVLIGAVPGGSPEPDCDWPCLNTQAEGLVTVSPINFVGMAARLRTEADGEIHPAMNIVKRLLSTDYLWERVRMRGGAYGVSWSFNPINGHCFFSSYRDPQVEATLEIYRQAPEWLRHLDLSADALEQVKIGALGADPPRKPSRDTYQALYNRLVGLTYERRVKRWETIRAAGTRELRECADILREGLQAGTVVSVLGGREHLTRAGLKLLDLCV